MGVGLIGFQVVGLRNVTAGAETVEGRGARSGGFRRIIRRGRDNIEVAPIDTEIVSRLFENGLGLGAEAKDL